MSVRSCRKRIGFLIFMVGIFVLAWCFSPVIQIAKANALQTLIVSAEGLVDANSDLYKRDKGIMIDDLREDAKRQVIEKAVGVFVESSTLVENYTLVHDRVLTRTDGLIKRIIKVTPPWIGDDGFAHMLMKAEVYVADVQAVLQEMSRDERITLIKEHGNPKISVAVNIRDAERGSEIRPERSLIAENIIKERIKSFGYRVWSEDASRRLRMEMADRSILKNQADTTISVSQLKDSDFTILGEAKFKTLTHKLRSSGITVTKYVLTSWTVQCVDNHVGEEVYFNNKVPREVSWADEDAAIEDIGRLIGAEFSKDFFEEHLRMPTKIFQVQVVGLPSYEMGEILKKEFIGLRPVLNVDFRDYDESGMSLFEIEFTGVRGNFNQMLNNTIITPLNRKLGEDCFKLTSAHGLVVRIGFSSVNSMPNLLERLNNVPPASLATASPERLKQIVKDSNTLKKVQAINPESVIDAGKRWFFEGRSSQGCC